MFSQVIGVGAGALSGKKGQVAGGFGGQTFAARCAVAAPRCGGRFGRCWVAYGLVVLVAESRYGTEEMGRAGTLRQAL